MLMFAGQHSVAVALSNANVGMCSRPAGNTSAADMGCGASGNSLSSLGVVPCSPCHTGILDALDLAALAAKQLFCITGCRVVVLLLWS